MKPVNEMTAREKTDIFVDLLGWKHEPPYDWLDKDDNWLFSCERDFDLYFKNNMDVAWLVLNWWQGLDERILHYFGDFQTWFSLSPKKAQSKWLDIILELAIQDGMVGEEEVK